MALTDTTEYTITIKNDRVFEILKKRIILEDGLFVAERNFRQVLEPGDDTASQPNIIRQLIAVAWTPAIIAAYQAARTARQVP